MMNEINENENFGNASDYSNYSLPADEAAFELIPAGTFVGRCVTILQLGTLEDLKFGGKPRKNIIIGWELHIPGEPETEAAEDRVMYIQNIYRQLIHELSKYTIHMEGWTLGRINKDFNPLHMLEKPCLITIKHVTDATDASKIKARVAALAPLMKGQTCPPRLTPLKVLLFAQWNQPEFKNVFDKLAVNLQKMIESSAEYKELASGLPLSPGNNEGKFIKRSDAEISDLPF